MWAVISLMIGNSDFDRHLGIACLVIVIVFCGISPNRLLLFGVVVGFIALQGWFAVVFSHDVRSWWILPTHQPLEFLRRFVASLRLIVVALSSV